MTDDFREPVLNDEWKEHLARWITGVSEAPTFAGPVDKPEVARSVPSGGSSTGPVTAAATVDNRESPDG